MPRTAKGARLYLRKGRRDSRSGRTLADTWVIRDGAHEISTGCGAGDLQGAEAGLQAYLAAKWTPPETTAQSRSDPAQVLIADVLALYGAERAPELGGAPAAIASRLEFLLAWWGDKTIADVRRSSCKAYAAFRQAQPDARYTKNPDKAPCVSADTARRELEDLSGAIGFWNAEHKIKDRPAVWLPEKAESPRDALTRTQAASLLWASMGHQKDAKGRWAGAPHPARSHRAHLRRFMLIGLYTGTRHKVIRTLLWEESATNPWVDLNAGVIYRRGRQQREARNKRTPVVKIPARLLAHMRRWREADRRLEAERRKKHPDFRLVSVLHYGGAPLAGAIRTGFAGCVRSANLPADITPHWMRHTAATWLMERGVDLWIAGGFLGMNPTTLIKHYGHLRPDYQSESAGAITSRGVSGRQSG